MAHWKMSAIVSIAAWATTEKAQAKILVDFVRWALTDGQRFAPDLGSATLPQGLIDMELKALQKIRVQ